MHLSVKVPIEYPIKAIHIKVNSTIQAAKVELLDYKKLLITNNHIHFIPRTLNGITNLGLNIELAKREILTLTYTNYDRGPTLDHNQDGTDIWEFGMPYEDDEVYIKLKIKEEKCICLSFKQSTGPFTLPYKDW